MNKLLMEENDRLHRQVSHLVYENGYFRQHTQTTTLASKDTSCESVVTSGQHHLTPQHPPRDASPAGLLSIAEETLAEFLSKATGTAVEWVQMPGMKPGPDSIGIVSISHGCTGVAARACGLVGLEPTRVAEILKDLPSWLRDCRAVDVLNVLPTANGGTIELLYMQLYALTTLAPACDFWMLRYTSVLEDGSLVAAAYYYHGLILDEGNTEKFHGMAVAALQAADEYFKESKKSCEAFSAAPPLSRNPPLWGTMKYLSEKIPKDTSSKVRINRDLYSHEKIMETAPTLPDFALALKPDEYQLPAVDPSWNMEHTNKRTTGPNQLKK